ncbi:glycoside hydrolase family 10 protein [Chryseobacterium sp. PTM-20240506]|uniref:glycoside hydrolase family 10 protein n=1 Tax=unclassified Chryseobacterium TaxID=2593645 RepID=UPI0023581774|nr:MULTISPECIES: family 10 glycosylhydrolase [unclassified Chryseobacterium]MDC8104324.1 family 10 glycosylhydrolase [Chryseobacterium sp. B21-037]MDQ1803934.1 family 10 glycosylhydrolase [Chryseobacterium sp. CKR4-1]
MKVSNLKLIILLGVLASCGSSRTVQNNTVKPTRNPNTANPVKNISKPPVANTKPVPVPPADEVFKVNLPAINREFRGAWIASVANINWPSRNDLSIDQQKAEAISMLDMLKDNNFNAVIFQVRPSADALYTSSIEPWSYFLTGETGRSPYPNYDPLQFWIEESHKRGLELHVWLNPYRAHHTNGGAVNSLSMANKLSDIVVRLKNGMYWFDPANPKTQGHVSNVVKDIVQRYDIDAVHFDDYFYPYATYNKGGDFPDNATWNAYVSSGGTLSRADWRRDNVNKFVERIYKEVHAEKNYVKFGISPFGIWKPGYPAGITGSSQYDELYADAKLWLNKGWVDYFSPQLYWPIDSKGQGFEALLNWWESENTMKRHLWPGLNTVEIRTSDRPSEIKNQIELSRQILKGDAGEIHWSIAGLTRNPSMLSTLRNGPYKEKALVPKSPWIKAAPISTPTLFVADNGSFAQASWSNKNLKDVFQWALFKQYNGVWEIEILTLDTLSKDIPKYKDGKTLNAIAIKAIDRLGNESDYMAKKIK